MFFHGLRSFPQPDDEKSLPDEALLLGSPEEIDATPKTEER